jgi:hypothetical protein
MVRRFPLKYYVQKNWVFKVRAVKEIVSWDFDSIFMILSFSLDVKQLPLDILFFIFDVFILKLYHILFFQPRL